MNWTRERTSMEFLSSCPFLTTLTPPPFSTESEATRMWMVWILATLARLLWRDEHLLSFLALLRYLAPRSYDPLGLHRSVGLLPHSHWRTERCPSWQKVWLSSPFHPLATSWVSLWQCSWSTEMPQWRSATLKQRTNRRSFAMHALFVLLIP